MSSAIADQNIEADYRLKTILTSAEKKRDFSQEFEQLKNLSAQEKQLLSAVWESPQYPWKWRWFSAMFMAEHLNPNYEKKILDGLKDPLFLMRLASVKALSSQDNIEKYHSWFIDALNDKSLVVRKAAIQALSIKPDQTVVLAVEKALFDDKNRLQNQQDMMGILQSMLKVIVDYDSKKSIHSLAKLMRKSNTESNFRVALCNAMASLVYNNFPKSEENTAVENVDCIYHWKLWYTKHQNKI